MNTQYYFSLPEKEFPDAVIHAPFEDQYQVWKHLRCEIVDKKNHMLFTSHFIPLLIPVIQPYLGKVRAVDREDFMQDIFLAFFRRLADYNPDHNGRQLLGNVFFKNVARGEYRSYAQKSRRYSCMLHFGETLPLYPTSCKDGSLLVAAQAARNPPISYGNRFLIAASAEDEAIARIEGQHLMQKYRKMKAKYKSGYTAVYNTIKDEDF